jgi:phosphoribosylanthranilate isomerase
MTLKTLVKVGSITNLSDARYCAGMGVDMLGFRVIENQSDFITPKAYQEMRGWISGPQIVAEIYGIQSADELLQVIENYQPDYLELGLKELVVAGSALTIPFMLSLANGEYLNPGILPPAYVTTTLDGDQFEKLIPDYDVLVAVANSEQLYQALHKTGIIGVTLNGSREIRPGLKNYDSLAEILEALEVEN